MPGTITPTAFERRDDRLPASPFGTYSTASTAACTRRSVSPETFSGLLSARDTVMTETPARAATSFMRRPGFTSFAVSCTFGRFPGHSPAQGDDLLVVGRRIDHDIHHGGAVFGKGSAKRRLQFGQCFHAKTGTAIPPCHRGEIDLGEIHAGIGQLAPPLLGLDQGQTRIVEDDHDQFAM